MCLGESPALSAGAAFLFLQSCCLRETRLPIFSVSISGFHGDNTYRRSAAFPRISAHSGFASLSSAETGHSQRTLLPGAHCLQPEFSHLQKLGSKSWAVWLSCHLSIPRGSRKVVNLLLIWFFLLQVWEQCSFQLTKQK